MEPRPGQAPIPDTGSVLGDFDALIDIWQNRGSGRACCRR
jgi:hypothetical protein